MGPKEGPPRRNDLPLDESLDLGLGYEELIPSLDHGDLPPLYEIEHLVPSHPEMIPGLGRGQESVH